MDNFTKLFIKRIQEVGQTDLTKELINQVKYCLTDYIGVTFAGAKIQESKTMSYLEMLNQDCTESRIIGSNQTTTLNNAAFINGFNSHVLELDDGHRFGMMHLGAPIFSALIPLSEKKNISPERFMRGTIAGYEAAILIAKQMQPHLKLRGYHATGVCGVIGVAMAIGVAMEFDDNQLERSLVAAATSASGLLEVIESGSEFKPYNVAQTSMNGLVASFTGIVNLGVPKDILGGERGLYRTLAGLHTSKEDLVFEPNQTLEIMNIYIKPFAACRHCHPAIDATIACRKANDFELNDIKDITVYTYDLAVKGHDHKDVYDSSSAKMSTPYCVAVSLMNLSANMEDFEQELVDNPTLRELMNKTTVIARDDLSALNPEKRAAEVKVSLTNGQSVSYRVDYPKGEPENPITKEELIDKFISLSKVAELSTEKIEAVLEKIELLDQDIKSLLNELYIK